MYVNMLNKMGSTSIFGKYQDLYDLNKKLTLRYVLIPNYLKIRQQLWNLFATDMSPGLLLISQYYFVEY